MNLLKICILVFLACFSLVTTAHAAALNDAQRALIDRYLASHGLNIYGDPKGTCYPGGTPLFDMRTGRTTDRYEYVLRKFPTILHGFVTILPVGTPVAASAKSIVNDCDPRRVQDRFIDSALEADEANRVQVEQIRAAIAAHDFKAVHEIFGRMATMPVEQLRSFAPVLKDARRMLNGAFIDEISVTTQVHNLLQELQGIEARLIA